MKRISKVLVLFFFITSGYAQSSFRLNQYPDGWHKFTLDGIRFDAEIQNGAVNGKGNAVWPDGSKYSGTWRNNRISGLGTYTWPNGDRYEGSFSDGQPHGHGTMYWNDGRKYAGKWKAGLRHGKGKQWDAKGNRIKGQWQNDQLVSTKENKDSSVAKNN